VALAVAVAVCWSVRPAAAYPEFKKEFEAKHPSLLAAVETAKCGVCHTGPAGKNKKERNAYGAALSKHLKKGDKKNVEKIQKALDTVADEHSAPHDDKSPTFGDLIKEGKLPV